MVVLGAHTELDAERTQFGGFAAVTLDATNSVANIHYGWARNYRINVVGGVTGIIILPDTSLWPWKMGGPFFRLSNAGAAAFAVVDAYNRPIQTENGGTLLVGANQMAEVDWILGTEFGVTPTGPVWMAKIRNVGNRAVS